MENLANETQSLPTGQPEQQQPIPAATTQDIIPPVAEPPPVVETPPNLAEPVEQPQEPQPGATERNGWQCPKCGKGPFEYRSFLVRHVERAHKGEAAQIIAAIPGTPGDRNKPREQAPKPVVETAPDFSDITGETRQEQPEATPTPVSMVNYQAMSEMLFDMSTGALSRVFGPEWQPSSNDERAAMVGAIKAYAESKQLPDIPPGMMLALLVAIYSAPRIAQPNTKTKLYLAWQWVKVKVFRIKPKLGLQIIH